MSGRNIGGRGTQLGPLDVRKSSRSLESANVDKTKLPVCRRNNVSKLGET